MTLRWYRIGWFDGEGVCAYWIYARNRVEAFDAWLRSNPKAQGCTIKEVSHAVC
jgi:hypothetical protein